MPFIGTGPNLTSLNASNLGSGTVPTARLGTGTASSTTVLYGDGTWKTEPAPTTSSVLNATAGASAGAIGTYAWLCRNLSPAISFGGTYAGSSLAPAAYANSCGTNLHQNGVSIIHYSTGAIQSGTWRAMGGNSFSLASATVWLRIS